MRALRGADFFGGPRCAGRVGHPLGPAGPPGRLRRVASLPPGYPGVVLPYAHSSTTISRFTHLYVWSESIGIQLREILRKTGKWLR